MDTHAFRVCIPILFYIVYTYKNVKMEIFSRMSLKLLIRLPYYLFKLNYDEFLYVY